MAQLELFAQPDVAVSTVPTVDSVRSRLNAVLALLRSATELPWSARETSRWKVVFPQMADWLPEEEREEVRQEFLRLIEALPEPSPLAAKGPLR